MLRFCCLGSGSGGNAWVVEAQGGLFTTRVLVDNGFGPRQLDRRLARAGLAVGDLDAVLLTHEHADHVGGIAALLARGGLPLICSAGTQRAGGIECEPHRRRHARAGESIALGELDIRPFAVPHDAAQPLHFTFGDGETRLGIVTDLGCPEQSVADALAGLRTLVIECNHDLAMLHAGNYPPFLKVRIAGDEGHLSNEQAATLCSSIPGPKPERLVAAHLSRQNNRRELAQVALAAVLGCDSQDIAVADQESGLDWIVA
jgi:phosphoribosyl 1,2-cyclic phosphodiesterase